MSEKVKKLLNDLACEELMVLYQSGEYLAFEELYLRHSAKVFEYLKKKVSAEISQDLLQDIFMKMHKAKNQYSKEYPFLPWLFTISRNTLFDYFKSFKKSTLISAIDFVDPTTEVVSIGVNINLAAALNKLPENQKRAIELRYLEDWSFEKIAEEIRTSPENVRQQISRGLKKLRSGFKVFL